MRVVGMAMLLLVTSMAGCSGDDRGSDGDGDGLGRGVELDGWSIIVESMERRERVQVDSDPSVRDTDGDGLDDGDEFTHGTDPRNADTDGDGLTDCQELVHTNRTECEDPTFNGPFDGGYKTNPARADSDPGPSRYKRTLPWTNAVDGLLPQWGDGISDGMEVLGYEIQVPQGTRFVTTDPRSVDTDGDGLEDGEELLYGGDPTSANTDGDPCIDGQDPFPAFHESFRLGLGTLELHRAFDSNGGANIAINALMVERTFSIPHGDTFRAQEGANDLRAIDPPAFTTGDCIYTPYDPWMNVQILVFHEEAGRLHQVDIHSQSPSAEGSTPTVRFNAQTGLFAWATGGDAFEGPVRFDGADASLVMHPVQVA